MALPIALAHFLPLYMASSPLHSSTKILQDEWLVSI